MMKAWALETRIALGCGDCLRVHGGGKRLLKEQARKEPPNVDRILKRNT